MNTPVDPLKPIQLDLKERQQQKKKPKAPPLHSLETKIRDVYIPSEGHDGPRDGKVLEGSVQCATSTHCPINELI